MKTLTENTTRNYVPVEVPGTDVTLEFSQSVRDGVTRISATPKKGGSPMGLMTYNVGEKSLTVSLKPLEGKNLENIEKILTTLGRGILEILGEDK